jgi:hypothetical protein
MKAWAWMSLTSATGDSAGVPGKEGASTGMPDVVFGDPATDP